MHLVRLPICLCFIAQGLDLSALAQTAKHSSSLEQSIDDKAQAKAAREADLRALEEAAQAQIQARTQLEAEIETLKTDRAALNTALIETAARIRAIEERVTSSEQRLAMLNTSEVAIRRSLESRRLVIAEALAALQRMGRRPPPAVLVKPDDMLEAVRSAILLGAVVPDLKMEADTLASDLNELMRLRQAIGQERDLLKREVANLSQDQARITALMAVRQQSLAQAETQVVEEREKAAKLARETQSLRELVTRLETDLAGARKAAEEQARETRQRLALAPFKDPARLAPKVPFTATKGLLPLPVSGEIVRSFNDPDGLGGTARGLSFSARSGALVSAPADGWVAFAGPFRSFGQLLILNAGEGYYILLAGMDRITVDVGQFVLAGEPVATMGTASPSAAIGGDAKTPVLYVEFRKDGGSIDPAPWWAQRLSEKVRG